MKTEHRDFSTWLKILGFKPKENTKDIFIKQYPDAYVISIDLGKEMIHYGDKILCESKTTQNFSQAENFVVLECVNRLLEKGYKPENIVLEKTWGAGHGTSGRLDICVTREDGSEYLLIECKTHGKEFEKEFTRMKKDGGQLFTYFKFSNKADIIMLYSSELKGKEIVYRNEIVKIEDDYRTGDVKDFYEKWNKLTKDNGVFDKWVNPYNFESKALTINDLEEIKQEDSSFIFNRFLEILRHNVVSDKGNAFNRIFTLFLCKIYDEKDKEDTDKELEFQWFESPFTYEGVLYEKDTHVTFQIRLTDLYKKGMKAFLEKNVTDLSENEFNSKYSFLTENQREPILNEFRKIRLEKYNDFAIKDVYDHDSFIENAIVVKEIVELLQGYKLRYTKKQQYLSDFFELLLTTGLKQESGQFFTPVPVAQFVIKSLPIDNIIKEKLQNGEKGEYLPYVIDYAAGSGHFLTETMHEVQRIIDNNEFPDVKAEVKRFIKQAKEFHFDWAFDYVYGIEKDYRLVKVGKVGCYLHGDGLANVIHSDGLANFKHKDYKGKLSIVDKNFERENKQFDIIVSNPPYSVSAFKNTARSFYKNGDFELYDKLTDNSSEIECLFIERTKQLLKDGGVAGIILPSSILSNTGIYSKSREIILQYFDIVGITELGSNTFMATGTNTVTLFLRRRNNYESRNLKIGVEKVFTDFQDVTLNGVEKPMNKYVNHVWGSITFEDYITLLKKMPNKAIEDCEMYQEYRKKIKAKNDKEFWHWLLEREADKLYYFIIAYPQKVVLIKSGEKDAEKRFLGYEFSNRRGSEGIHPLQRGKNIEDCTQLFDPEVFDNPEKASTYIYKAFAGDYDFAIDEAMQNNVSRHNLVDMLTFDRVEFEKNISLSVKKKVKIESKWEVVKLSDVSQIDWGNTNLTKSIFKENGQYDVYSATGLDGKTDFYEQEGEAIILSAIGARCGKCFYAKDKWTAIKNTIVIKNKANILLKFLFEYINNESYWIKSGTAQPFITMGNAYEQKIPLPPLDIQQKIVSEIEVLEAKEKKAREEVEKLKEILETTFKNTVFNKFTKIKIGQFAQTSSGGTPLRTKSEYYENPTIPWLNSGEVRQGNIYKAENFISEIALNETSAKLFPVNSVLVAMYGATGGQVGILRFESTTNQAICGIFPNEKYLPEFLYYHLKFQYDDLLNARTGVARDNLSQEKIKNFEIFLPPLSEQQKIVSEIEKIEEKIKILETEIAEMPKQKEAVLQAYL
jgi:type I restriction enzyme M protein